MLDRNNLTIRISTICINNDSAMVRYDGCIDRCDNKMNFMAVLHIA